MVWLSASFSSTDLSRPVTARLVPAVLTHRELAARNAVTEVAVDSGAKVRSSIPVTIEPVQRLHADTVGRWAHHSHLGRTTRMDDSRRNGQLDRLGSGSEADGRGGEATTLAAQ